MFPPAMVTKKLICGDSNHSEEACSEPGSSAPNKPFASVTPQDEPVAESFSVRPDNLKMPGYSREFTSTNTGISLKEQNQEVENDVSIIDLLSDDAPKIKSKEKSVPEAHVAFAVKGLGQIRAQTPAQSPKPHQRFFPPPPKVSRLVHSSANPNPISLDVGIELNAAACDFGISRDVIAEPFCSSRGILEDIGHAEGMKIMDSYVYPDIFENISNGLDDEEENICSDSRQDKRWKSRNGTSDDNFLGEMKSDAVWTNEQFHSRGHRSISFSAQTSEMYDNGFEDHLFQNRRSAVKASRRYDISETAPSAPYFRSPLPKEDFDFLSFDWDSERSNFNMFSPPAWSFSKQEDMHAIKSSLSEESCSSTAVMEERSFDLRLHSVKLKESKTNLMDELEMSFSKQYGSDKFSTDEIVYTSLDGTPRERDLTGSGKCENLNWLSSGAGYCSAKAATFPETLEECISLLKEEYSSVKSASAPSSCLRSPIEMDNISFDCNLMSEDKLFSTFPVPNLHPRTDLSQMRSKSKIPDNSEPSNSFKCENDISRQLSDPSIKLQKPATHPSTEVCFPYSSYAGNFQKDTEVPDVSGHRNARKDDNVGYRTFKKSKESIFAEKESLSSQGSKAAEAADCEANSTEHEESKSKPLEQSDCPESRNAPDEADEAPMEVEEVPIHREGTVDKLETRSDIVLDQYLARDQLHGSSSNPPQVGNKDSMKRKSDSERIDFGSRVHNSTDRSYQVMLESYVLQLLCVHKVLLESSEKDSGKKV